MAPERLFVSLNRVILVTVRGPLLSPLRAVANLLVNSCAAGTGNNAVPAAASPPGSRSPAAPREEASRPGLRSPAPGCPGRHRTARAARGGQRSHRFLTAGDLDRAG